MCMKKKVADPLNLFDKRTVFGMTLAFMVKQLSVFSSNTSEMFCSIALVMVGSRQLMNM